MGKIKMDIVDDLRKAPHEEERQYKREARIVLGGILEEAADEIEQLRKDKQLGFELMDAFIIRIHLLRQGLYRIANMKHDEDFGLPPIGDAMKIAQDALEEE
jgi:mevalonate kinase